MFSDVYNKPIGKELWKFLNQSEIVVAMKAVSKVKKPAVEAIGDKLLQHFGEEINNERIKRAIGHMVRQVMEINGYQVEQPNVVCRYQKLFKTGYRYCKAESQLIEQFSEAMS